MAENPQSKIEPKISAHLQKQLDANIRLSDLINENGVKLGDVMQKGLLLRVRGIKGRVRVTDSQSLDLGDGNRVDMLIIERVSVQRAVGKRLLTFFENVREIVNPSKRERPVVSDYTG